MGHETEHVQESTHSSKGGAGKKLFLMLIIAAVAGGLWFGVRAYGNSCPDTDADGLDDCVETNTYFTDQFNPDTDGDTVDDGIEVLQGRNPLKGAIADTNGPKVRFTGKFHGEMMRTTPFGS